LAIFQPISQLSETVQDRAKAIIEVVYALSTGAKVSDFGWPRTAVPQSAAQIMCLLEFTTEVWKCI